MSDRLVHCMSRVANSMVGSKALLLTVLLLVLPISLSADFSKPLYFETKNAGKVPFEHESHLRRHDNCSACHNSIFHIIRKNNVAVTMAQMEKGKSCGACHNKDNPRIPQLEKCSSCHTADTVRMVVPDFGTVSFSHSKHIGMFSCTDCHDSIFKAERSSNPHFSMLQMELGKSCGSCHDGKTAFSVKGDCVKCHQVGEVSLAGGSLFSHKAHLDMSFQCSECHNRHFVPGPNRVPRTMQDMEKGKSCGACHDSKTGFSVKGDCQKCHRVVGDISFSSFNARFSHLKHLEMFKCEECHSSIFIGGAGSVRYSMADMEKGKSCGACHDDKSAFGVSANCEKCHFGVPADITISIRDAGKVSFSHQRHRSMLACGNCHNRIFTAGQGAVRHTMADMEKGKSCGTCHDGKAAFSVKSCSRCHPVRDVLFSDDARFSHDLHLSVYSCNDCHGKIFNAGPDNRRYTMAMMENGGSCGACHDGSTVFSVKGDCGKCHKSTVNAVFKVRETGNTVFSHNFHNSIYKCTDCHNQFFVAGKGSRRHTMSDMENGLSCGNCHNEKTAFGVKSDCQKCHAVKQINYNPGSAIFSHMVHIAMFACSDCHPKLYIPGVGNKNFSMAQMEKGKSCGSCHDDKTAFGVKSNCKKCHPGTPKTIRYELSPNTGNVEFSHKPHAEKGYNCGDCHYKIVPSGDSGKRWVMKEMDQGNFCGACHGFSMAFSVKDPNACERCHQKESDWRPQLML